MENDIVYLVFHYVIYESDDVVNVCASREIAERELDKHLKENGCGIPREDHRIEDWKISK